MKIEGTDHHFMVATNLVLIVVGPGRETWDRATNGDPEIMKKPTSQQVSGRTNNFRKTCKDQHDLIGKIYRFKGRFDHF